MPKLYALKTTYEQKHFCQNIFSIPQSNDIYIYITEIYLIVHVWNNMRVEHFDNFHFWLMFGVSETWINVINKDAQYFVTML